MGRTAEDRLAARIAYERKKLQSLSTLDYIPYVSPQLEAPHHLARVAALFDRAIHEPVFALISVPPQHGKSVCAGHGVAKYLVHHPSRSIGIASYQDNIAHGFSREIRKIVARSLVPLNPRQQRVHEWFTGAGGRVFAAGVGGGFTSKPISGILLFDDPFKNREEAESEVIRNIVYDFFSSTAMARRHPTASVFIIHTRWHDDDLIGRLLQRAFPWVVINLPAIADGTDPARPVGTALWPSQRPLSFLEQQRAAAVTDYDWESQWMGRPRPKGGAVFKGVKLYDELPKTYTIGKGVDLAYTAKTRADVSVSVVLVRDGDTYYVVDVRRAQTEVDGFVPELRKQSAVWPGKYLFFTSSTEKGIAQFSKLLPEKDIRIDAKPAMTDKFTRAQPCATQWNRQKILVPSPKARAELERRGLDTAWFEPFMRCIERFTGLGDQQDDDADALVNAFTAFPRGEGSKGGGVHAGTSVDDISVG